MGQVLFLRRLYIAEKFGIIQRKHWNIDFLIRGIYLTISMNRIDNVLLTGPCCHFQDQGGIEIGDGCLIGHNVVFATINHDLYPQNNRINHYAPIKLGKSVWVGSNSTILPGVTIGDWAVVAAGAVVTRDIPPYTIAGGVPAKVLRRIDPEEKRHENII